MLVATGWASLKWLDDEKYEIIWTIKALRSHQGYDPLKGYYHPFQMHASLIYIVFILTLIIILGGCIVFFVKTIVKKDDQVINGMMGQFSRYHFFPLLCVSALFIIGECVDQNVNNNHDKNMVVCGLVFSLLGLASMIFIYIMTDLNTNDWWVLLLLKKGTYSSLIVLMWYYFCYDIYYVHLHDKPNEDPKKMSDWTKGCGIAFSIIFGIGSLSFSFVFKDLVA